jgi:hypothetical protein
LSTPNKQRISRADRKKTKGESCYLIQLLEPYQSVRCPDKFDAARIAVSPDYAAVLRRLEPIQRQIEFEGGGMMCVGVKHGSAIVDIHHQAGMAAANTIDAKQRQSIEGNTFQGSTFNHRTSPYSGSILRDGPTFKRKVE